MKNWPLYMSRSTSARFCGVSDADFARAIDAGEVQPIPSDGNAAGRLFRKVDLESWIASRDYGSSR